MNTKNLWCLSFVLLTFGVLSLVWKSIFSVNALAYYSGMSANVVVGQPNFNSNSANQGISASSSTLSAPRYAMIAEGKLLVVDGGNNRVLIWNKVPTQNNTPADVVIGQTSFSGTSSLGCVANGLSPSDSGMVYVNGKLFIADAGRNRVLVFDGIPTTNGASASYVLGQSTFTSCNSNQGGTAAANTLTAVTQLASDGQRLAIADSTNNRVLIFNSIPTASNASADVVVGQSSFSGTGTGLTASTMNSPRAVGLFNGKLIVGERTNFRITIFNSIPTTNGASADVVLGQSNFTTATTSPPSTASTVHPFFLSIDSKGRLYAADRNASRYLIWNSIPTGNNASSDIVIGQPDFTQTTVNNGGLSASSTNLAKGIFANENQMVIAEPENNRVLIFNNVLSGPELITGTPETIANGRMKISGSVKLGERGKYGLHDVKISVNGSGYSQATSIGPAVNIGNNYSEYSFFHEFEPWSQNNGLQEEWVGNLDQMTSSKGYTLNIRATSLNSEEDTLFFFTPFKLNSILNGSLPTFTFSVNSQQWSRIKDNISSYEVHVKKKNGEWTTYLENIPADETKTSSEFIAFYDKTTGVISVRSKTKTLAGGSYLVQIIAKDKWGHTLSKSNEFSYTSTGSSFPSNKPNSAISSDWFPLQINSISGVKGGIISSFSIPSSFSYTTGFSSPVFQGIAFSGAKVTLQVTNEKNGEIRTYDTVSTNSLWKLTPKLFSSSLIDVWVTDMSGHYNELPTVNLKIF